MAKVWHAKLPTFGLSQQNFPADYEVVAEVESESLKAIFQLTNHIDWPWWNNVPTVKALKQTRSTSVGDVVEINGKYHLCEMAGWREITAVPKGE